MMIHPAHTLKHACIIKSRSDLSTVLYRLLSSDFPVRIHERYDVTDMYIRSHEVYANYTWE